MIFDWAARRCWWNVERVMPIESAIDSPGTGRGHSK